ncbi:MAG: chorismate synthase [Christensenellaceae bacterium]|jgi:chorismate synthase
MNVFGKNYRVEIFGESHARAVGAVIDGIPAGFTIDMHALSEAMARRAPGKMDGSTQRQEDDKVEILCGLLNNVATGAPLCGVIYNKDTRSADYSRTAGIMRPGHADHTGYIKFDGQNDIRGGGHFSGRLTAPLVFAGSIARQYLAQKGMVIGAHILRVADVEDIPLGWIDANGARMLEEKDFPVLSDNAGQQMQERIRQAAEEDDSVGGVVECAISGAAVGMGEPFFWSVESALSQMMFSIPAVKGIEFGDGFKMAEMKGSEANDALFVEGMHLAYKTNHNGGLLGGITNGMPILFRVAIKPTASIGKPQDTVDIRKMENTQIKIEGRHDSCIVPRAVEVVKAAAAIVMMDLYLEKEKAK